MITYLARLTNERDSLTESATDLTNKAASEERDLTDTEKQSLTKWAERCGEIDGQLAEYGRQAESQRAYARLRNELDTAEPATVPARQPRANVPEMAQRSWGDIFITSDAFRDYPGAGTSRRVEVPFDLEERAAIGIGTLPAAMVPPFTFTPPTYTYQSPLLDVVGKTTTSSNAIQYVEWTPNPQDPASVVLEGELKPEANMTASVQTASLATLAHWKAITRQALEDVPQIRSTVENRLRQGIVVALEEAVTDALTAASIPPVTGSAAGGDTLLGAIREGVGVVQAAGYGNPNAVLLNPADWAALDVATIGNAGGAAGQSSFWGMRAVAVPALPAGTAYVGNFQLAVQLFTRAAAEVLMTDSHADYFVRNLILLLAEVRAVATVPEPAAAAKCSVGAVAATGGTPAPAPSGGK